MQLCTAAGELITADTFTFQPDLPSDGIINNMLWSDHYAENVMVNHSVAGAKPNRRLEGGVERNLGDRRPA